MVNAQEKKTPDTSITESSNTEASTPTIPSLSNISSTYKTPYLVVEKIQSNIQEIATPKISDPELLLFKCSLQLALVICALYNWDNYRISLPCNLAALSLI